MGTWDTGPFDNDTAADFANTLDDAKPEEREALIRGVLTRTALRPNVQAATQSTHPAALRNPCPHSPTIFGRSRTRPSPASSARRPGQPRTGSTRQTGSSGEPTSPASAQSLPRHHRPSRCSMSSNDRTSPTTELEPEPQLS
ncbi:DUF4259 domain-containing protein [Streptomyces sp. NPDC059441]|uniref:DUF4259 domain-containing protein n=1 Tax=Streptomyces sp. NPDC059441 TaxID=3346829 RepID=UPI00367C766D